MKTIPAALLTHFANDVTTVAEALYVQRTDGAEYGFTDHDEGETFDGLFYDPEQGLSIKNIVTVAGPSVGNLELTTLHDGTLFTTIDLLSGVWRNAEFYIFRYNWASPSDGVEPILAGTFGEVELRMNDVIVELRDLRDYMQHEIGSRTSKTCRYRVGINTGLSHCPVKIDPSSWEAATLYEVRPTGEAGVGSVVKHSSAPNRHFKCTTAGTSGGSPPLWNNTIGGTTTDGTVTWTTIRALSRVGSITNVTSNQVFRDNAHDDPADWFGNGEIEFTSGPNAGLVCKVKQYDADGTFTIVLPLLSTVAAGHTYIARAGCWHRRDEDCIIKFDAVRDFGGEPDAPGLDTLQQAPEVNV